MTDGSISAEIKDQNSVSAIGGPDDLLDKSNSQKNISQILLKESTSYQNDSQEKAKQAREYAQVSNDLKQKANAVRARANFLRQKGISEEEKLNHTKEIIGMLPEQMKMLVPRNASPEVLDKIADELESRAKQFRQKSDDLLQESEAQQKFGNQLKEQPDVLQIKDTSASELQFKSASAYNQGLLAVLKKLGIARLDAEYKDQIAYSESKAQG